MELLQSRRYKSDEISASYFHEIKTQIECIVEVCKEGEISVHEADNIIHEELMCSMDYQSELWEMLDNLDNETEELAEGKIETEGRSLLFRPDELRDLNKMATIPEDLIRLKELGRKWKKDGLEKALENMERYNDLLIETQDKLLEIFESVEYQRKRKEIIKQSIIQNGLPSYFEGTNNLHSKVSMSNIVDRYINNLITYYPEFENDFLLLKDNDYLEKKEKKLYWKKTKQALAEYFEYIKPSRMKEMRWQPIEMAFVLKDNEVVNNLKNSLSRNGNAFKEKSLDFKKLLEIKNSRKR